MLLFPFLFHSHGKICTEKKNVKYVREFLKLNKMIVSYHYIPQFSFKFFHPYQPQQLSSTQ